MTQLKLFLYFFISTDTYCMVYELCIINIMNVHQTNQYIYFTLKMKHSLYYKTTIAKWIKCKKTNVHEIRSLHIAFCTVQLCIYDQVYFCSLLNLTIFLE